MEAVMLSTSEELLNPCRVTQLNQAGALEGMRQLIRLLEEERGHDRARIDQLVDMLERQGRILVACRQIIGDKIYGKLLTECGG
jgi:hypothetical protein